MFIIKFQGGLGNQMFQYALYLSLQSLGYDVRADLNRYEIKAGTIRHYELEDTFGIKVIPATETETKKLYAGSNDIIKKAIIKRIGKKTYFREKPVNVHFCSEIFDMKEGYLEGYWQSELYFRDAADKVIEAFKFKYDDSELDVVEGNTVAIHVRMGDYLEAEYQAIYGNICTKRYYSNAIKYMREHIENPKFIVFSDDVDKAKKLLQDEQDLTYATPDDSKGVAFDMYRISSCKHQIIANSSYSWWAAWLNSNREKIVIAPSKWINGVAHDDVVPGSWMRI